MLFRSRRAPADWGQESQASSWVEAWNSACLSRCPPGREAACRAVFGTWGFFRTMHGKTAPPVIVLGISAKEDAWIAVLLTTAIGILIASFFLNLNELVPSKNLFEIIEFGFNRVIAIPITLIYTLYFFILPLEPLEILEN